METDVLVIGGGPGGATLASYLAQNKINCILLEKENFPRFQIGESLLPGSMRVFDEIGFMKKLNAQNYIHKYGAKFINSINDDEIYFYFGDCQDPWLEKAYEVPRQHFDGELLNHAKESGAQVLQPQTLRQVTFLDEKIVAETDNLKIEAKYIVDASGRNSALNPFLGIKKPHATLKNIAVYSHYKNLQRYQGTHEGDITIGVLPYSAWSWFIPFQGDITSVGVVCPKVNFDNEIPKENYIETMLRTSGILTNCLKGAERVQPVRMTTDYSHVCDTFWGDRWLLVGDSAAFLDPIFSSGVHISVSTALMAGKTLAEALKTNTLLSQKNLGQNYEDTFRKGVDRFYSLINIFYRDNFVDQMKKTIQRKNLRRWFTAAIAGDVWNEENPIFQFGAL